jgi:saccharopine dehydrogenase-like NADP-dependent oxidoreductase
VLSRRPLAAEAQVAALGAIGAVQLEQLSEAALSKALTGASVVLLTAPGPSMPQARVGVLAGVPVVSVSDDPSDVRCLLQLNPEAEEAGVPVAVGAAMVPGLSCLLAAWAASLIDEVSEVHVASLGTGGAACSQRHRAAFREAVEEWRDGAWARKVAGSGRELVYFPDYAGVDCYRVNRPDPVLLVGAFPALRSATTRAAASQRDHFTSWLPRLRRPLPEGTIGALRVEVRGWRAGSAETAVVGASGRPALLAGAVAAVAALRAASGQLRPGAGGLSALVSSPGEFLAELSERGVRLMAFEGAQITPG